MPSVTPWKGLHGCGGFQGTTRVWCLPRDYTARGCRDVMGLYRDSTLCASCTSGRISKLMQGEIAPYRTGIANTFCQGPVATGLYMLRS